MINPDDLMYDESLIVPLPFSGIEQFDINNKEFVFTVRDESG